MTNQRRGIESGPEDGRVMTEEQIEVLRHQIACYAAICERLVQTHRDLATIHQDSLTPPGMRLGGPYYDPFTIPKITSRQRWTPTPAQLHILENLFEQGIGTPSKAKIKETTLELSQHGQISEGNVYNWFQNRRARSKRRHGVALPNNSESEVDTVFESQNKMKAKLKKALPHDELPLTTGHLSLHGTETSSEVHYFNQETKQTQGTEQLVGNMEIPESFANFCLGKSYNMEG